jgi:two-component system sensor histidine kinase KdpD
VRHDQPMTHLDQRGDAPGEQRPAPEAGAAGRLSRSTPHPASPRLPADRPGRRLPRRRIILGLTLAAAGLPMLTLTLVNLRDHVDLSGALLLYLLLVVVVATAGGIWPAALAAVGAVLLANWYFTPPFHRLVIAERRNLLALLVFLAVAGVTSALVDLATRRTAEAARARAEAEALARLGGTLLLDDPLPELVEQLRATFALDAVAVLRRDRQGWRAEAVAGGAAPIRPEYASDRLPLDEDTTLTLSGRHLTVGDRRVLRAFADQLAAALQARRLAQAAAQADRLAAANDLRAALLAAVSHDLRTPLASIKTSVTSLLQHDVQWPLEATEQFLATIDEETDRLDALVGNLLDMSRLQTGALTMLTRPVGLEEVVPAAVAGLADRARRVELAVPETLPRVEADAALLERVIANVVANAVAWSPPDQPVQLTARDLDGRVALQVIDHGPGIAPDDRERVFQPFQRLGDSGTTGVGLGLAVARGFIQAMDGTISLTDTPGGGLTVLVTLPTATGARP